MIKDFTGFMIMGFEDAAKSTLGEFYYFIITNRLMIETVGFYIAGITILAISIYLVKIKIEKKSILNIIHENKKANSIGEKIVRFITIYFVLMGFYFIIFNLVIEWLAIAVDSILIVIFVVFYLYLIAKHKRHLNNTALLYRTANAIDIYYDKFIELFTKKKTIGLAITGLLVLHVFTDVANYLIPYVLSSYDTLYLQQAGSGHAPIFYHFAKDFKLVNGVMKSWVFVVYILNIIGMFMLFLGPGYIWMNIYKNKHSKKIKHRNWYWIFFGAVTVLLIKPIFEMTRFNIPYIIGVDIKTHQISAISGVGWAVLISAMVMIIFYILSLKYLHRVVKLAFIAVELFFGLYLYYFFRDTAKYYTIGVVTLLQNMKIFLGLHLFVFLMITIIFYIGGFVLFVYNTKNLYNSMK